MRRGGWVAIAGAIGFLVGALLLGFLWDRAAGVARIRADSANARLARILDSTTTSAHRAEGLLGVATDSIGVLATRLAAAAVPIVLRPAPAPGSPDELVELRRAVVDRDARIATLQTDLVEAAGSLRAIAATVTAARDTVAALRTSLVEALRPKFCPTPTEPPRIRLPLSLRVAAMGWSVASTTVVGAVAELDLPASGRWRLTVFAGPGAIVTPQRAAILTGGGRLAFRVF